MTKIFFVHNSDPKKLSVDANISMTQLSEWFAANQLSYNVNKTCHSIFGTKHRITTGQIVNLWQGNENTPNVVNT